MGALQKEDDRRADRPRPGRPFLRPCHAYWEPQRTGYAATGSDQQLSGHQNTLEEEVQEMLSALVGLVEAQHRRESDYDAKPRELGYLR